MPTGWSEPHVLPISPSTLLPELFISLFADGDSCVVHVTGELDHATREQLVSASIGGDHPAMVIDLAGVTFMDCSGYGSLVTCRHIVESAGRSLAIRGQTGQPERLLNMIAGLGHTTSLPADRTGGSQATPSLVAVCVGPS